MNRYEKLLGSWCDYLLSRQNEDGGFLCEACSIAHGRGDNAVCPLVFEYAQTGDGKYLSAAVRVISFREKLTCEDGAVRNDFDSEWKGTTVFSAINIYKTLSNFSEIIPADFRRKLEVCLASSCRWIYENIRPGFHSYINYYAAAACADAMYGKYSGENEYLTVAAELLAYCMEHFSESGLLCGEGQPHDIRTKKHCAAVDIGYNAEESLPCLIEAAMLLEDGEALRRLTEYGEKLLCFMLPDGGWDNSFGSRNNKWTYYGSRTSDGCPGGFVKLGKYNPVFVQAARRNFGLLEKCTCSGALYGGRFYAENGQKPCVHHTFCHACSLTDAILSGISDEQTECALPCDRQGTEILYFPELDTYKIRTGDWSATVSAYDYAPGNFVKGGAHASGGSLSLLYHSDMGPVIAGSVYEYRRTEPLNMQPYEGEYRHSSLIPRVECERDGVKYASCLDTEAEISAEKTGENIKVKVRSRLVRLPDFKRAEDVPAVNAEYVFSPDGVKITVSMSKKADGVRFILPVIENTAQVVTDNSFRKEKIFFLTGGFAAWEYSFCADETVSLALCVPGGKKYAEKGTEND